MGNPKRSPPLAESLAAAAGLLGQVLSGSSLSAALTGRLPEGVRAAAQNLSFNALREYGVVDAALGRLLEQPLHDTALRGLLLAALAELRRRPQAAHTTVDQAVEAAARIGAARAKGLVNAVLRAALRRREELERGIAASDSGRYKHPQWWIDTLRAAYPGDWERILAQSNERAPMTLRVNLRRSSPQAYMRKLEQSGIGALWLFGAAVLLDSPRRVEVLPGFAEGEVSVQDAGAQCAAPLLDVAAGMRVLDACAAPGGKAAHILELAECRLTAVDIDPARAGRIEENCARLGLRAQVAVGDCAAPRSFWDGEPFQRILLDAPCSASGVTRRHPDIKWLRREADIARFGATQRAMLEALWPLLAPDGKLLYATCSVFPGENASQVDAFGERHPDAVRLPVAAEPFAGMVSGQILPCPESDGFYYAVLKKST